MVTLLQILFYLEMLLEFKCAFLFPFSDSKPQHAELRIKGAAPRPFSFSTPVTFAPFLCSHPRTLPCVPFPSPASSRSTHYILYFLPPQHTCRPRSGTCLCLWGPVFSSSFTCGLCKSGSSSSSHTSTTSFPSTLNTTCTTSKLYHTTSRAQGCTRPSRCPRGTRPDPPDTGPRPRSCWSRTWREESKR